LAYERLSPQAAAQVNKLSALEAGATLATISTWADETRSADTASWHYVNFPRCGECRFDAARDWLAGSASLALDAQSAILRSTTAAAEARLTAQKSVAHLVADEDQPLHAGYRDDKGGNTYQVQAFGRERTSTPYGTAG
jgi:hypothetical protein